MNVREALEQLLLRYLSDKQENTERLLAPHIERALRAAFYKGWDLQGKLGSTSLRREWVNEGVTAGVAAMVVES